MGVTERVDRDAGAEIQVFLSLGVKYVNALSFTNGGPLR